MKAPFPFLLFTLTLVLFLVTWEELYFKSNYVMGSSHVNNHQGLKCSGYCTKDPELCVKRGGRIVSSCNDDLACCDPLVSRNVGCGDKAGAYHKVVTFKSPNYPNYSQGDLVCEVKVPIRNDTNAIRVEMIKGEMDGHSFLEGGEDETGACDSDMIFIRGFNNWSPPPRCGKLTGYSFLIDRDSDQASGMKTLSVLALMSSPAYRWHITISQISNKKKPKRVPSSKRDENDLDDYEMSFPYRKVRSLLTPYHDLRITKDLEGGRQVSYKRLDDLIEGASDNQDSKVWSIINGEDTVISLVPWQASIRLNLEGKRLESFRNKMAEGAAWSGSDQSVFPETLHKIQNCSEKEGFHFCGGAIISEWFVLSAAHCFYGTSKTEGMVNISGIKVVVGDTNLCTDESSSSASSGLMSYDYDVHSVTLHYAFDNQLIINDLALIRVKKRIKLVDHVKPIRMAKKGEDFVGQEALLSGWGDRAATPPPSYPSTSTTSTINNTSSSQEVGVSPTTSDESESAEVGDPESPDILQSSRMFTIQNQSFCNWREEEEYSAPLGVVSRHPKYTHVFNSTLCTLSKDMSGGGLEYVSAGRGDSGGPLVVLGDTTPTLVGIVSYGIAREEDKCSGDKKGGDFRPVDYFVSVAFYSGWIDLAILSYQ